MLKIDLHCHSTASYHAFNSIEELIRKADENQMEAIAITDHSPGLDNTFWLLENVSAEERKLKQVKAPDISFFKTFINRYQPSVNSSLLVFKGIECNIIDNSPRATDVPIIFAPKFDIVIASIHLYPWLIKAKDEDSLAERVIMAMDEPIDIIGHPYNKPLCPNMEPIVKKASEKGVTLELNNSSIAYNKAEIEDIIKMLILIKKYNCQLAISSDAHMASELGNDKQIRQLLRETAIPNELIINRDLDSTVEFVKERKKTRSQLCE